MVSKAELLTALAPMPTLAQGERVTLVDDQDVRDIMRGMRSKQVQCRPYYDRICKFFDADDIEAIGQGIWEFLKNELSYYEEPRNEQLLMNPKALLLRGSCDCKNYALFTAGVIDGLNRLGAGIPWCFRFVPSDITSTAIGHVFVVLDPGNDEIYVDPVLGSYDLHMPYLIRRDEYVKGKGAGVQVAGLAVAPDGRIGELVGVVGYSPDTYIPFPLNALSFRGAPAGTENSNPGPFPEGTVTPYGTATWIPDGYPLLTQPWLTTDGRLVLRPYVAPPPGGNLNVFTAYVLAALQVAVNEHAPTPYNVNFSTPAMSGAFTVQMSLYPAQNNFAAGGRGVAFSADPNWLDLPQAPDSLLDQIRSIGADVLEGTVSKALNAVVPGLGTQVLNALNVATGNTAAVQAATNAETALLQAAENQIVATAPATDTGTAVPSVLDDLKTFFATPWPWLGIAGVVAVLIILSDE